MAETARGRNLAILSRILSEIARAADSEQYDACDFAAATAMFSGMMTEVARMSTREPETAPLQLGFAASTVERWFQYRCERKTVYEGMRPAERTRLPILEVRRKKNSWAEFGVRFEAELAAKLAQRQPGQVLRPISGEDALSREEAVAFLRRSLTERFAYQFPTYGTPWLARELRLPANVDIRPSRADLVIAEAGDTVRFRVVDIKATQSATLFHKAQVAFYALAIRGILKELGIPGDLDDEAQIWHLDATRPEGYRPAVFRLSSYEAVVKDFFHRVVPQLAQRRVSHEVDDTFFHVYFKCEECQYIVHCERAFASERAPTERDLSAVAGMTHQAKRVLLRAGVRTVGELASSPAGAFSGGWTLQSRGEVLVSRAKAIVEGETSRLPGRMTWLMPGRVDVAHILVVDIDPVEARLASLGYHRTGGDKPRQIVRVLTRGAPDEEREALRAVLGALIDDLGEIDRRNRELGAAIQAHIFTYEASEAVSLQEALGRHLDDPQIARVLLEAVRIFPPEHTIPEPEYRGVHHLPATALRSVLEQIYALPIAVSYDMRNVGRALSETSFPPHSVYDPGAEFRRRFSSRLNIDVCRGLRTADSEDIAARVADDVAARLEATAALIDWIIADNARAPESFLRLMKRPFQFQSEFHPLHATDLDGLQAYAILASRTGLLAALVALAQPVQQRRDGFRCFSRLRLRTASPAGKYVRLSFDVPPESRQAELGPGELGLVLTDGSPDILLNPAAWRSFSVDIVAVEGARLTARMFKPTYEASPFATLRGRTPEDGWFIDQTFVDATTHRAVNFLRHLAAEDDQP